MLAIGLMSGTSADGVDAALVDWPDGPEAHPYTLLAYRELAFEAELQERVHTLAAGRLPGADVLRELASLDVLLAERFAEAAFAVAEAAQVSLEKVRVIGSHGQTLAHHPEEKATLQIADPSVIAERTGCTVVADFRPRDLAAGGEGAPLAPFFHLATLADPRESRVALNLGGIANLTWLPAGDPEGVVAFDVGPANTLVDGVVQLLSRGEVRMDRDGRRALLGRADRSLLARLLDDDYLKRPPPKSTGRERYGRAEAEKLVAEWQRGRRNPDDLLATLVVFTAESVARACRELLPGSPKVDRVLVGGGGARNPAVLAALVRAMPRSSIQAFDQVGVPADAAEAMAFSLMGRNALLGIPNHLPHCTGARRTAVLGEIVPGRSGRI
jgi:anhydro-N-acetylmuramic acid kinase